MPLSLNIPTYERWANHLCESYRKPPPEHQSCYQNTKKLSTDAPKCLIYKGKKSENNCIFYLTSS